MLISRNGTQLRGKNQMQTPPIQNDPIIFKSDNPEREAVGFIAFLVRFFQVPFVKKEKDRVTVRITGGVYVFERDNAERSISNPSYLS